MSSGTHSSGGSSSAGPHLVPVGMALTPKVLLKRHKLPVAAHLHMPAPPPGLDLSRPLMLYKTYNSTKVRGVSLRPGRDGALAPVGPAIVIPDSYTGWFAIVTSEGHTAPFFSSVEQVATSKVSFFLTRYDVPAYTNLKDAEGRMTYQKTVVQSGHVLKLMGIFEDLNARRTNSTGRGRDASSVFNCDKYAQCLNYRNEVVFLPFSASGRFYTTAHKTSKNPNHVYLMAHILKNHKLPLTVRLVCGYMPRVPCNFTGVLRLEQAQKEAVILACTMTDEAQATLFEIDVASNFVLTPVKDPLFPKSPIFLKTVSYCEDEAEPWRRQIKVTHHVTEKRSRSLTRSLSDKFVEPMASVRPLSLSFLSVDNDKKKGRSRDRSRDSRQSEPGRDKSREQRFREFRSREKSVEKTKFKYHDYSNSFSGFPIAEHSLEAKKKSSDHRKISKQNTYVLQNGRGGSKHPERRAESDLGGYKSSSINNSINSNRSVENLEYSRVADDISPIPETEEDVSESHYAEICDYGQRGRRQAFARGHPPLSLPNLSFTLEEENHVPSDASGRLSATFSDRESRSRKFSSASGDYKENIPPSESGVSSIHVSAADGSRGETGSVKGGRDRLEKDKANEVYIIRVVVKDQEDDKLSTISRNSKGGYYMKLKGFEVPQEEIGKTVLGDEVNGYDSMC
ncbi:uncharacterized protein [Penaeus vannamei]|uniref:uncharacterized protein n=1 Tax=Penaeus vannamei TaxID=6689 RepID=UPI00387F64CB